MVTHTVFRPTRTVSVPVPAPVTFGTKVLTCEPPVFIPGSEPFPHVTVLPG